MKQKMRAPSFRFPVSGFLLLALLRGAVAGAADATVPPETVVADALAHSPALKAAGKEVEAAVAQGSQARALGLPGLDVKASAMQYNGLEDAVLGPTLMIPAIEERYSASIGLTQPLFTGGRVSGQRDRADSQRLAVVESRRGVSADVALQALMAYWNWSKAFYSVEVLRASARRMEAHNADMQNLHEAGLATDNDALATEVLLEQTRLQLEKALHQVDVARARLSFLTGKDLAADAVPETALVPADMRVPPEPEALAAAATHRPEPAARRLEAKAAESQSGVSRADFYPQLYLTARYEQASPNLLDFPPTDEWKDDAFAGVALTWSVLDWGLTRAKAAEALARAEQAALREQQTGEEIVLEVREARIALDDALKRVAVAKRAEGSARRNLEAATDLWKNGLARHADVLDAHAQLTDSEYQVIAARADVVLAEAGLKHATGRLGPSREEQP